MEFLSQSQCRIQTDVAGFITDAEAASRPLLNLTPKGARGKDLLPFFLRDRELVAAEMRRVLQNRTEVRRIVTEFKPRERRALPVEVTVSQLDPMTLEWRFRFLPPASNAPTRRSAPHRAGESLNPDRVLDG